MGSEVSRPDIAAAFRGVGAHPGDLLLFHSSLKSMGHVDGGPQTVIDGALDAVSPGGTVVVPTLWYKGKPAEHREEDFNLKTSPAWNGLVAETMRQDPRAIRSNHFTHSVSAIGPFAEELTRDHGSGRPFPSPWSETAFAEVSPWSKLYQFNALYAFIGCDMKSCTMKHWIESRYAAGLLDHLPEVERAHYRKMLAYERQKGPWCYFDGQTMYLRLAAQGLIRTVRLGDAQVFAFRTKPMVDAAFRELERDPENLFSPAFLEWRKMILDLIR